MKSYAIYRDIRKQALIFGLPVGSFAIQMTSVVASLLVIIFSFSLLMILLLPCWNFGLYIFLLRSKGIGLSGFNRRRLVLLSNRYIGIRDYEA